jgi:hypothetical protein
LRARLAELEGPTAQDGNGHRSAEPAPQEQEEEA